MKVVNITTDSREHDRNYGETMPRFCGVKGSVKGIDILALTIMFPEWPAS
jgi:hypothetical protein